MALWCPVVSLVAAQSHLSLRSLCVAPHHVQQHASSTCGPGPKGETVSSVARHVMSMAAPKASQRVPGAGGIEEHQSLEQIAVIGCHTS